MRNFLDSSINSAKLMLFKGRQILALESEGYAVLSQRPSSLIVRNPEKKGVARPHVINQRRLIASLATTYTIGKQNLLNFGFTQVHGHW
jgi:hypothetical protein